MIPKDCFWTIDWNILVGIGVLRESDLIRETSSHTLIDIPDNQLIIVPTTCELCPVRAPFQPAHFLLMSFKPAYEAVSHAHVVVKDLRVQRSTAEHVGTVPSE